MTDARTDEEIAQAVQAGESELFGVLIDRFAPKLRRYGQRFLSMQEDVEDVVQDAFIKAYQNIRRYDPKQPFSPWMYRIAHNTFVNALRAKARRPVLVFDFDTLVSFSMAQEEADEGAKRREMRELIERGLGALSPKYREVLILYYLEEQSYQDIADILQVPVGTVGVRLRRAKEALLRAYADSGIDAI
ncbi:MAG TPA: RNA polymerase sigma factor [Candidatus Paceibacterota bacterium]|nr:RNA polymerase sigma factor [Candidatus Paceibacterota bacterium]